ncbi:hypothetical protein [Caenimonas sp. SL110]|uniref:hypothetical protein n=1 Tax=Caenimonas sp. SL110 TaxID=1450524 RepID=UPI000652E7C5|nr:hypothetical protein [Caenimonas sp. SL110]
MTAAKATMALAFIAGVRTADSQIPAPTSNLVAGYTLDAANALSFSPPVATRLSFSGDRQLLSLSANETQTGFVIATPANTRVFLVGDPPENCEPAIHGEYGNVTQRTLNLICPEDNGTLSAHNTYLFSQDPNHTYLERQPVESAADLCTPGAGIFDPLHPPDLSGIFEGTELIQPLSMYRFSYVEKCPTPGPTLTPTPTGTRVTGVPTPSAQDASSTEVTPLSWAITAVAGVGLAGSIVICALRGRLQCRPSQLRQIQPALDHVELVRTASMLP